MWIVKPAIVVGILWWLVRPSNAAPLPMPGKMCPAGTRSGPWFSCVPIGQPVAPSPLDASGSIDVCDVTSPGYTGIAGVGPDGLPITCSDAAQLGDPGGTTTDPTDSTVSDPSQAPQSDPGGPVTSPSQIARRVQQNASRGREPVVATHNLRYGTGRLPVYGAR